MRGWNNSPVRFTTSLVYEGLDVAMADDSVEVIPSKLNHKIRVYAIVLQMAVGARVTWNSEGSSVTPLSGGMQMPSSDFPYSWNFNPDGWFDTLSGEAFSASISVASRAIEGVVLYRYIAQHE